MSTDLEKAFAHACGLFNNTQYDQLLPLLDPDIIMKRVDDPGSIVGVGNVIAYLRGRQAQLQPQFSNVHVEAIRGANGTNGQISGTARYQDEKKIPLTIPVRFTFTFARSSTDEDWLLINAFAAPIE